MNREEAIDIIRKNIPHLGIGAAEMTEALNELIPELRESEKDERVRKWLIQYIKDTHPIANYWNGAPTISDVLSWLEKQEEQKPAWSEFDKGVLKDAICAADILGNDESFNKGNPNLGKAFRVAKDWLKSLPERFNLQPKQEWSEEDEKMWIDIKCHMIHGSFIPFDKIEWLENRLKSLRPQPNRNCAEKCLDNTYAGLIVT